jgi:tetratricopeptide (TPR) repeat protein
MLDELAQPAADIGAIGPHPDEQAATARELAARQDWNGALAIWKSYCENCPDRAEGYLGQAEAHRRLRAYADADLVLQAGTIALAAAGRQEPPEFAVSYALTAQISGDLHEALVRWRAARAKFSFAPITWASEAAVCRALSRMEEADALTSEGMALFPKSFDIAVQHCDNAVWTGRWLEADTRLNRLQTSFADHPQTETVIAERRQAMGSVLQTGDIAVLEDMAATAEGERLWHAAFVLRKAIHARLPEDPVRALHLAITLRETGQHDDAETLLRAAMRDFPGNAPLRAAHARLAVARKDWLEAARRWQDAVMHGSADKNDVLIAAIAFREAGLTRKADKVLEIALAHAPSRAELHVNYAMNAERAGNHAVAEARWAIAHRLRADQEQSGADDDEREPDADFTQLARIAQDCHLAISTADWLNADLTARIMELAFPAYTYVKSVVPQLHRIVAAGLAGADAAALRALADRADSAQAWVSSALIWQALRQRVPDSAEAVVGLALALCHGNRLAEADDVLAEGMKRFPDVAVIRAQHASVPALRQDWAESARRWETTLRLFPGATLDLLGAAIAFREAGSHDKAEQILRRAIAGEPDRAELYVQGAVNAERAGKWPVAVAYWDSAHKLLPDDPGIRNDRGDARWQSEMRRLECMDDAENADDDDVAHTGAGQAETHDLMLAFEGLGDNCEFGIVQRHFGVDPIGLFRFGSISVQNLLVMLAENFARLGDAEFMKLEAMPSGEYLVQDTRGFYQMHSFVRQDSVDAVMFLKQQVKRVGFLKRKLLEDLASGDKIFVYKATHGITDTEINSLHKAMREHGPNWLLVVRRGQETSLTQPGDGLFVGTLTHLYDNANSTIDFMSWKKLLELAHRQRQHHSRRPTPA